MAASRVRRLLQLSSNNAALAWQQAIASGFAGNAIHFFDVDKVQMHRAPGYNELFYNKGRFNSALSFAQHYHPSMTEAKFMELLYLRMPFEVVDPSVRQIFANSNSSFVLTARRTGKFTENCPYTHELTIDALEALGLRLNPTVLTGKLATIEDIPREFHPIPIDSPRLPYGGREPVDNKGAALVGGRYAFCDEHNKGEIAAYLIQQARRHGQACDVVYFYDDQQEEISRFVDGVGAQFPDLQIVTVHCTAIEDIQRREHRSGVSANAHIEYFCRHLRALEIKDADLAGNPAALFVGTAEPQEPMLPLLRNELPG